MIWIKLAEGIYEGKPIPAEIAQALKLANIPQSVVNTHRLQAWEHRSGDESWWATVEAYARGELGHPFLTLLGQPGLGKTHLGCAIALEWLERGKTVLYYQVEGLLDALRDGYRLWEKGDHDGYHRLLSFTHNCSLLILDDLGAQKETEWAAAKLDQIIDDRYINKKPLIVTSNLAMDRLPDRIADRFREGVVIHLKGTSYRRQRGVSKTKPEREIE